METSIRVSLKTVPVDQVLQALEPTKGSYMYAVEGVHTPNPHVHMYLKGGTALATIRARLRKLGITGNGGYSITQVRDTLKTLAYFMKGGEYSHNLSEEVIQQASEYDEKVKEEMAGKKAKPKSALHEMSKTFNEAYPFEHLRAPTSAAYNLERLDEARMVLATFIIAYHREHDLPIRKHQLTMMFDTLMFWHPVLSNHIEMGLVALMANTSHGTRL